MAVSRKAIFDVALALATQAAVYYAIKYYLDSSGWGKKSVSSKQLQALDKMGHKNLQLDEYERTIANEVVHPDDIHVHFKDIGGLDTIISSLRESIIYPLLYPEVFSAASSLLTAPKGVLLYGPPGCGKTMLARALAKESGATFINIAASALTNKWYGESNKLVKALFGLAQKCQPCIVFIDEMEAFLRSRGGGGGDHEVTAMVKAEFMTLWDGLLSSNERILVLGATNRPHDIDPAFLRRMPKRFAIGLPDVEQRVKILSLMLQDTQLDPSFSIYDLAARTSGLSGSDLKEICRTAAMRPFREQIASGAFELAAQSTPSSLSASPSSPAIAADDNSDKAETRMKLKLRPLRLDDFFAEEDVQGRSLNAPRALSSDDGAEPLD